MSVIGLPATKRPASVAWSLEHNVGSAINPLGGTMQRVVRGGDRWRATLQWPPMIGDDAGIFAGWLDKVSRGDRWLYVDHPANMARGNLSIGNAVSNPYFVPDTAAAWTAETDVSLSVNARRLKVTNNSGSPAVAAGAYQSITLTASVPHVVVVDFDPGNTLSATVQIRNATTFVVEASQRLDNAPGRFCFTVTPSQAAMQIRLVCNSDGHIYFRNITVSRCALVNAASQTGNRLNVDGLPASQSALIKAGEFFCVPVGGSYELKRLTDDLDSDSSGAGVLVFEPSLRGSPSDNAPVVLHRPYGRFFIPSHTSAVSSEPPGDQPIHGFMLDAAEDVTAVTADTTVTDEAGQVIWELDASTLSLAPSEGSGTPTITRAGNTATRTNSSGVIELVNANLARFDYDPVTLAIRGLLVEEARTNLVLNSLLDGTNLGTQSVTVTAVAHTLSFYGTGTVTLSGVSTAGPLVGSGAYPTRSSLTFTPTAGSLTLTVTGTVQFAQLEIGSFASSFIPTAGASVARAADVITLATSGIPNFSAAPLTMYGEILLTDTNSTAARSALSLDDGTTNERHFVRLNAGADDFDYSIRDGAAVQADLDGAAISASVVYKFAGASATNDFAYSTQGGAAATDTGGTTPTPTTLHIGQNDANILQLNGHVRKLRLYNVRKSNADLVSMTT